MLAVEDKEPSLEIMNLQEGLESSNLSGNQAIAKAYNKEKLCIDDV